MYKHCIFFVIWRVLAVLSLQPDTSTCSKLRGATFTRYFSFYFRLHIFTPCNTIDRSKKKKKKNTSLSLVIITVSYINQTITIVTKAQKYIFNQRNNNKYKMK